MFNLDSVMCDLWPHTRPTFWKKKLLGYLLYHKEFDYVYTSYPYLNGVDMVEQVLEYLRLRCEISSDSLEQIPEHGPLIVVSNHPTGLADGLALLYAISRVRRDVKIITNQMLIHLAPLASLFIPVDNINGRIRKTDLGQMEEQLQNGGVLVFFPAGEVSRFKMTGVQDNKWNVSFVKLARKYRATILPVFIHGHNSLGFYLSAILAPRFAMLLLFQQMFRRRNSALQLTIGERIPFVNWNIPKLTGLELSERFRKHVFRLGKGRSGKFKTEGPIALPEERSALKRELMRADRLGTTPDGKLIYLWQRNGQQDAPLLRELGRLREIAFRAAGEGSGKRRDIDSYDDDYLHLIVWDEADMEIVGAYRLVPTARQVQKHGLEGLYSASLFDYHDKMNDIIDQGIELGRSFVQPRYWRRRGLDYLWTGIGAYLARYSSYRYLFGLVSISGGLPPAARDLLVAFYRLWFSDPRELAAARQPYPATPPAVLAQFSGQNYTQDLIHLKSLLAHLDCGIPPLFKQYTELGERGGVQFIDFGIDPNFNNCVDGLVLIDVKRLKPNRRQRYIDAHLHSVSNPVPATEQSEAQCNCAV